MKNKAFTLLETILYLALTAIFLGGVLAGAYNLIQSAYAEQTRILTQSEGNFLLGKFAWAWQGAKSFIIAPDGKSLTVNNFVFSLDSGFINLSIGSGIPIKLNANNVPVTALSFVPITAAETQWQGLEIKFTLKTQDFSVKKYLNE